MDSFLEESGLRGEVEAAAIKRVRTWQLERMKEKRSIRKRVRKTQ